MSDNVKLSGSAYLQTGVIDLREIGELAATITHARHDFEMSPRQHEEGWRVLIRIDLKDDTSLALISKLKATGRFIAPP
ncbi:hypothetical protein ACIGPN_16890 [Streptomyces afghaniensis]|uniref:hypothetical protein n=1 Tax=Streptomyces TaxID=1883 RepID=UPI001FAE9846|nr:hypothetical protein [Streptomyces sp. HP-A2021]UOB11873.1 hypothetical protein MQE23_23655 [Streptomyces sp. HP-A2021]